MTPRLHVEAAVGNPLCWFVAGVNLGSVLDPDRLEGFTRHSAELGRRGAGHLDRAAFDQAIDGLGASLDVDLDRDWVSLSGTCLERNLDRAVELAALVLASPRMSVEDHEVLRRETLHELDDLRDDDGSLAERHFQRLCAPGHSYGRTTIGTAESIERFDVRESARHHALVWAPEHLVLGVAGPVLPERAQRVASALSAAVAGRTGAAAPEVRVPPTPPGRRLYVIDKPQRTQCQMLLGHLAPAYGSRDFLSLMPVETAFGGMFSSRLMQEIRVQRGWSYGAGCRQYRSRASHWFRISLAPTREVAVDALLLTLELYERLAEHGITGDEFDLAVHHLTGGLPFSIATARQRMRIAVRHELLGLDPAYPTRLPDELAQLTMADSRAAADRWLRPRDLCIVVVGTANDIVPDLEKAGLPPSEVIPWDSY